MVQRSEHLPRINVTRARFPDLPGVTCGFSLLVQYTALRGFSLCTPVFLSPQKPTYDLICVDMISVVSPALN